MNVDATWTEETAVRDDHELEAIDPEVEARIRADAELTKEFLRAVFADPSILDEIPDGVTLYLVPDDDPDAASEIEAAAARAAAMGHHVHVHHMRRRAGP